MFSELKQTSLFKGMKTTDIIQLLDKIHYRVHTYDPDNVIAYACDQCDDLYILLQGHIRGEMVGYDEKNVVVSEIHAPDTFAEAFLFADRNKLLVNIIATTEAKVLIISKQELLKLLNNNIQMLSNYLNTTSNRFVIVSEKLKFLMYKTVKGKLANYILDLEKEHVGHTRFSLGKTHEELARLFGVSRPALTRNIQYLKREGLIDMKKKELMILDRSRLLDLLE